MTLEEEHERLHRRGEMFKFLVLVVIMLASVLTVAAVRPIIFDRIVPMVLGWDEFSEPVAIPPSPTETPASTATPAVFATETSPTPAITETPAAPLTEAQPTAASTPEPTATPHSYVVQRGDTLAAIAARFNVPLSTLVQINNIANPNHIQSGEVLVIPAP